MNTISTTFKTSSGKTVTASIKINNAKVTGTVSVNGNIYAVTNIAVIQNRKVLKIEAATAPYMPISDSLYNQVAAIIKTQTISGMTAAEKVEDKKSTGDYLFSREMSNPNSNL